MLTEFNFQSATRVKNTTMFHYIDAILHTIAMSACRHSFVHFYYEMYAEVTLPKLRT